MESKLFQLLPSKPHSPPIPINTLKSPHALSLKLRDPRRRLSPVLNSTNSTEGGTDDNPQPQPQPQTVEIRFKSRSKRRNKQMKEAKAIAPDPPKKKKKKWEDMNLTEKAVELYVGEKGALFWLNKFAYASIFIMIGGWILFRFVGPSLNLYQLDTPPLPPSAIFKAS